MVTRGLAGDIAQGLGLTPVLLQKNLKKKKKVMALSCNPSTWEWEARQEDSKFKATWQNPVSK